MTLYAVRLLAHAILADEDLPIATLRYLEIHPQNNVDIEPPNAHK